MKPAAEKELSELSIASSKLMEKEEPSVEKEGVLPESSGASLSRELVRLAVSMDSAKPLRPLPLSSWIADPSGSL